jgi:asparagine synthetase B (glutamine-hydrolysing)
MCGIAAFVGLGDGRDLTSLMDALRDRGPDGEGAFVDTSTDVHPGRRHSLAGLSTPLFFVQQNPRQYFRGGTKSTADGPTRRSFDRLWPGR